MIHKNKTIPSKILSILLVVVFVLGTFLGSIGTAVAEGDSNRENGTYKVNVKALKENEDTIEDNINPYIDGTGEVEADNSISFAYITIKDTSQLDSIKVRTDGAISPGPEDEVRTGVAIYAEPEIVEEDTGSNTKTYKFEIEDIDNAVDCVGYTHDDQKIWFRLKLAIIDEDAEYTVTFNSDGGTDVASVTAKWNETIIEPEPPQKDSRVFDGWYNGEQKIEFPMTVTEDVTLKAHWRQFRYVSYYTNGGGYKNDNEVNYEIISYVRSKHEATDSDYLTPLEAPIRSGYKFLGWYVIKNNEDVPSTFTKIVTPEDYDGYPLEEALEDNQIQIAKFDEDIPSNNPEARELKCYARWELEEEIPDYTVTFDNSSADDVTFKGDLPLKERRLELSDINATKEGYEASWFYGDVKISFRIIIVEDTVLTAVWDKLYTTTFDANGGVVENIQSGEYEEIANIEMASGSGRKYTSGFRTPIRTGYTFEGWYDEAGNLVTSATTIPPRNIKLTARWSKDTPADGQYTIDVKVWQEKKDEDSFVAQFFDKEKALLEVIDGKIYLTVEIQTEREVGGVLYKDFLTSLEQKMSDGTFKNIDMIPVQGEKKVKIRIEYPNIEEQAFIRCTIKLGPVNDKQILRVLLKHDTLEEMPDLIQDGDYTVDIDVLKDNSDEASVSAPFFKKEAVPLKVKDGKMLLTLSVLKKVEFGGTVHDDPIEWMKKKMPNGDLKLLAVQDMGDTKEFQLECSDITKPTLLQARIEPVNMTPFLRIAIKEGSLRNLNIPDAGDYKANVKIKAIDGNSQGIFDMLFPEKIGLPLKIQDGKIYLHFFSKLYSEGYDPESAEVYIEGKRLDYTDIVNKEGEPIKACYELPALSMEDTFRIEIKMAGILCGTADITFSLTPKYTVTFNSDSGTEVQPIMDYEGTEIPKPETLQKDGFMFLGWYKGDTKVSFPMTLTDNVTLKAHWGKVKVTVEDILKNGDITTGGWVEVIIDADNITYEYSIDGQNWKETAKFEGLEAGVYTVKVREKENPEITASKKITIKTAEVLKPIVTEGKANISKQDLNKDNIRIDLDGLAVTEMTIDIPSANKETTIEFKSGMNLPKIKVTRENQLTLEITENTSYITDNRLLQLPKGIDNTEAIKKAIEILEGSKKDIKDVEAISVGGKNTVTFGNYVKITLKGKSGKDCIFIKDGTAKSIEKVSKNAISDQTGSEYCYDDGSDLVIMTKHFTEFATYKAVKNDNGDGNNGSDSDDDDYSWDEDGDYSVDIQVLHEDENKPSLAGIQ